MPRRGFLLTTCTAHRSGPIERVARELYTGPGAEVTENHTLAEVARRVPKGVVCLLSALQFHGLTMQLPHEVWVALPRKGWRPRLDYPRLRVCRFSGRAFTEGVKTHAVEGTSVRVYGVAKTVADCFKYRNKVGLDVRLEALRDCWRQRRCTMDALWHAARSCRVANVMRP